MAPRHLAAPYLEAGFVSTTEAAELMGCSVRQVQKLCMGEGVPQLIHRREGRALYISRKAILDRMADQLVVPS